MTGADVRVSIVLPRGTFFSPRQATSIDLCVHDFVRHSRFVDATTIHCNRVEDAYSGFSLRMDKGGTGHLFKALRIARQIRREGPDVTVVHQHLPTAFLLSLLLPHPVLLHTHNFQKPPSSGISRTFRNARYKGLSGLIFVSRECEREFAANWPEIQLPRFIVHNGLDMASWRPSSTRRREILVVGRAAPEKGILEALKAAAEAIEQAPDWSVRLILSESAIHPLYFEEIKAVAAGLGARLEMSTQVRHEQVKEAYENAEIAVVLSTWREPFGRTALEAHAGGAALITSSTGGLREVSEAAALTVDPCNPVEVREAMETLMRNDDLRRRLAADGRRRAVDLFDMKRVAGTLDGIYAEVAGGRVPERRRGRHPHQTRARAEHHA